MNPRDYAQLLYDTLEGKTSDQQDHILLRFKALVSRNKEAHLAPFIERELAKIHEQKEREKITYITSSFKLSRSQKGELENIFPEPREFCENPSLVGGVAVRIKDIIYNGTTRKKIELLRGLF